MNRALNFAIAAVCCSELWWSYRIARADENFRRDKAESLQLAIALVPDQPKYYIRLAQLQPNRADQLLEEALSISGDDSMTEIDLGLLRESAGDFAGAEKLLLRAYDVDHTYLPRWTLANYYFRRGEYSQFWNWARKAAEMPAENVRPLFELCWRVQPDAAVIAHTILTNDAAVIRQFLVFLIGKREFQTAPEIAERLIERGSKETDRAVLLSLIDQLIVQGEAESSKSIWNLLGARHWIALDSTLPENAMFARPPLQAGFDWRLSSYDGLHSWPGPSGLEVEFSGREPESSLVAEQVLALEPGAYKFDYEYRTSGIAPATGLRWRVVDAKSGNSIASSQDLSHETSNREAFTFQLPAVTHLVRLRLEYQRSIGTPRIAGRVVVVSTKLSFSHELSQVRQLRRPSFASSQMDGCPQGVYRAPGISMQELPGTLLRAG